MAGSRTYRCARSACSPSHPGSQQSRFALQRPSRPGVEAADRQIWPGSGITRVRTPKIMIVLPGGRSGSPGPVDIGVVGDGRRSRPRWDRVHRATTTLAYSSASSGNRPAGRAAGLMDPADPGRDALLVEQAGCLTWAGRPTGAEAT